MNWKKVQALQIVEWLKSVERLKNIVKEEQIPETNRKKLEPTEQSAVTVNNQKSKELSDKECQIESNKLLGGPTLLKM